jgi:hypothetical protein
MSRGIRFIAIAKNFCASGIEAANAEDGGARRYRHACDDIAHEEIG